MKKVLFFFPLFLLSFFVNAQTFVSTSLYNNANWTIAGSPYIVTINLVVFDGVTLTIDPGVEVKFMDGLELDLRGKLIAVGTAADSITFTSAANNPVPGIWNGIRITGTTNPLGVGDQLTMKYCKGLYADVFADMDLAYHGPYIFEHCYFKKNIRVSYDGGMPYVLFSQCDFITNYKALDFCQFGGLVRQSRFLNNAYGVDGFSNVDTCYFSGHTQIALSAYGAAIGNTVENNNIGVQSMFNAVNDTFLYNTVRNNSIGVIIQSFFNGSIVFKQNWICDNTVYNIKLINSNNADISGNCWCSKDDQSIRNTIYDGYINTAYGLVTYNPVATNCPTIIIGMDSPAENKNPFSVFPNPSNGLYYLNSNFEKASYTVYDAQGRLVISETKIGSGISEINLHAEASGLYFVQLVCDGNVYGRRIVKE